MSRLTHGGCVRTGPDGHVRARVSEGPCNTEPKQEGPGRRSREALKTGNTPPWTEAIRLPSSIMYPACQAPPLAPSVRDMRRGGVRRQGPTVAGRRNRAGGVDESRAGRAAKSEWRGWLAGSAAPGAVSGAGLSEGQSQRAGPARAGLSRSRQRTALHRGSRAGGLECAGLVGPRLKGAVTPPPPPPPLRVRSQVGQLGLRLLG